MVPSYHPQDIEAGAQLTPHANTPIADVPVSPHGSVSNPSRMENLAHSGSRVPSSASTTMPGPDVPASPPRSVPNPNRMEHLASQSGYMWTLYNRGPAAKRVKGEDGYARSQSLNYIDDGDEFEKPAGSSNNKRKAAQKVDPSRS
ncbi:hypothetical protein C8J55DRAFT_491561 [Lentinula edodes]|uniref:Uncharacterized protein n=1 Tax=Lentinula lateritia TaxID=40482 RepID=A0A9W8ZZI8_9AGAR|nr:hypothetical protein C8J55DRAFT_491561 [Lentinula edodes]